MLLLLLPLACIPGRGGVTVSSGGVSGGVWDSDAPDRGELALREGQNHAFRILLGGPAAPETTHLFVDAELTELRGDTTLRAELRDWDGELVDTEEEPSTQGLVLTTEALDVFADSCVDAPCELPLVWTVGLQGEGNVVMAWSVELSQPFGEDSEVGVLAIEEVQAE